MTSSDPAYIGADMLDTIVIGAGMAGIACAQALTEAGRQVLILDKGRGIGGRMATRRVTSAWGTMRFDHGAQYFTVGHPAFAAMLASLPGAVAAWDAAGQRDRQRYVGTPGMAGLPRALAEGLDVRQGVEATALRPRAEGWEVVTLDHRFAAARVVLTVPAPQVAALIGVNHPLSLMLAAVEMAPCLTLMAAFPAHSPAPFISLRSENGPLAWIAQDSTKPTRPEFATAWVAQANPDWSVAYLEEDQDSIVARMLPLLCDSIGTAPEYALYSAAHRWRYARVTVPLGRPFLQDAGSRLYLGGDWCLGPRVEAAWQSGTAIAHNILELETV